MKFRATALSLLLASLLASEQASALTIDGLNYKLVSGTGGLCPDGKSKLIYNGKPYCRTYKASLTWDIPTTRVNGVALQVAELRGYEVYWTRRNDATTGVIKVTSGTGQIATLEVFKPDEYYFAISAIDTGGLKSALSPMVSARVGI